MSKIGNYNLGLQEQANDLGFSTVQEALNSGDYEIANGQLMYIDEQTKAHKAWLEDKADILNALEATQKILREQGTNYLDADALDHVLTETIAFVKKGEM